MTVQPSQGHDPGDTPPEELDQLIRAARELVGSRPSDRAGCPEHLAIRLDAVAEQLVSRRSRRISMSTDFRAS